MNASRRGFFGFLAGAVALPAVAKLDALAPIIFTEAAASPIPGFTAELMAITRKAFIPKIYVQIYQSNPMLSMMLSKAKEARP